MIEIGPMTEYDGEVAEKLGILRRQLSTKYDGSPLDRERLEEIMLSPYHDILLAVDNETVVGMVVVSVVMMTMRKNVYMEDLVVDEQYRGQGIGGDLLEAVKDWGRAKDCQRLEFTSTSRENKENANKFYEAHGIFLRDTGQYRAELAE
jgi:ribosomal protein S18 acetylase RimI-like enzyme